MEQDIETKVQKLHDEHGFAIIELQFLYDALRQVRACRRVLKWTYVYGYYLDDSSAAQPQVEFHDGSFFSQTLGIDLDTFRLDGLGLHVFLGQTLQQLFLFYNEAVNSIKVASFSSQVTMITKSIMMPCHAFIILHFFVAHKPSLTTKNLSIIYASTD